MSFSEPIEDQSWSYRDSYSQGHGRLCNVWLYNPAETIDPCLPAFDQKGGIVVLKVERGSFERLIKVDEIFDTDVSVVHDDSEGDRC